MTLPLGPNAQVASDENINLADQYRADQAGAQQGAEAETITKVGGGVNKFTDDAGEQRSASSPGVIRGDSSPIGTGSVLDTARSQTGFTQAPSEVTADSIVAYQGMEIRVSEAEALGLVTKQGDQYIDPLASRRVAPPQAQPDGQEAPEEQAPEEQQQQGENALDADAVKVQEALLNDGGLTGDVFNSAVDQLLEGNELHFDASDPRLAQALGMTGLARAGALQHLHHSMTEQAAAVVQKQGVTDMEGFMDFARSKPGAMREALTKHVLEGQPDAWGSLAREYAAVGTQEYSDDDVLGADFGPGVNVYRSPDGRAWLEVEGEQMPWRDAWRRGLIKVS
jgi:hypothetical protein